jgi:membrane protein
MRTLERITTFPGRFLFAPAEAYGGGQRSRTPGRIVANMVRIATEWLRIRSGGFLGLRTAYFHSRANDLAAAIAYYALISILPIILGLLWVAGLVLRTEAGYQQAVELVLWIVPNELAGESLEIIPQVRDHSGIYGVISLVGFIWVGGAFFAALGRAMNQIYGVPDRALLQQRLRGIVGILAFAVLFTITVVTAVVPTVVLGIDGIAMPQELQQWPLFSGIYQALSYVVAVLMAIPMFGIVFLTAPAAGQRLLDVIPGSAVIGLVFVLLVQIFPVYLRIVTDWNLISGTAGLLSLALLWFYILAHMFIFGAFLNSAWQRHRRKRRVW